MNQNPKESQTAQLQKFCHSQNVETKKKESFSVPKVTFPECSFPKHFTQKTNSNTRDINRDIKS